MYYRTAYEAEHAAEIRAEREQDRLDKLYLKGAISEGEYDAATHAIELRVRRQVSRHRGR